MVLLSEFIAHPHHFFQGAVMRYNQWVTLFGGSNFVNRKSTNTLQPHVSGMESLVYQLRSDQIGFAVNEYHGASAFVTPRRDFGGTGWNNGVLEYWAGGMRSALIWQQKSEK